MGDAEYPDPAVWTHEYKVIRVGGLFRQAEYDLLEQRINMQARLGWELVGHNVTWLTRRYALIFRRPRRID